MVMKDVSPKDPINQKYIGLNRKSYGGGRNKS